MTVSIIIKKLFLYYYMKKLTKTETILNELKDYVSGIVGSPDISIIRKYLTSGTNTVVSKAAQSVATYQLKDLEQDIKSAYRNFKISPKNDTCCTAKSSLVAALTEIGSQDIAWFKTESEFIQIEPIFGGSRDSGADVRVKCIEALTQFPWFQVARTLIDRIGDTETIVRMAAIKAISAYNGKEPEYIVLTKTVCGDINSEVLGECFRALNSMETDGRLQIFEKHLNEDNDELCLEAAFALGETRLPEALTILLNAWEENIMPAKRELLLHGISIHKSKAATEFIKELLTNPTYYKQACNALI
jgi:HEAT repeat protein